MRLLCSVWYYLHGPSQEMLVLIAYANSECSDEPAHLCSLATTPAAHIHKVWKWMRTQMKRRHVGPLHSHACIFQARPYAYVIITKVACAGPLYCKHCQSSFTKKYPFRWLSIISKWCCYLTTIQQLIHGRWKTTVNNTLIENGWKVREKKWPKTKKSTAPGIPRRSPIQVLTGLDVA